MRKLFLLSVLFFMTLAFIGCTKSSTEECPTKKLTLNLQEGDPPSLNPYVGVDLRSRCLFLTLFEPLMRKNADGTLKPAAAQSVDIDSSQTIYTFHIRPHVWSNNEPVTSYHFEQAWKYALSPKSFCFRVDLFYPIKNAEKVKKGELPVESLGISAPDPHTLIVVLEHPTPYFLDLTATSFMSPLYTPSDKEPLYFNGPYCLKEWVPDQKLVLHANPVYWDAKSMEIDEIHFTMIKDPMTAFALYEKGELDLVGDPLSPLPFDMIPTLELSNRLQRKTISRIFYLLLNTETYPLSNPSLRKALALSIDRDLLSKHLFFGEIPTLSLVPTTLSTLNQQDLAQEGPNAAELFEQAMCELNIEKKDFPRLVLSYAELSGQKKLAEFVQAQWKLRLGIETDIVCNEWNVHAAGLRKGNYQIGTLHLTTLYPDPMFYLDLFKAKSSPSNYCRWENEKYRSLLKDSEMTCDPAVRQIYLKEAEKLLLEQMPAIALFTQNLQYLKQDRVNLDLTDLGIYDFKHSTLR